MLKSKSLAESEIMDKNFSYLHMFFIFAILQVTNGEFNAVENEFSGHA
jgi:hypothetical protein